MRNLIVIGSLAMQYHLPERVPSQDYDIIGKYDDVMHFIKMHGEYVRSIVPIDNGKKIIAKLSADAPHSYKVIEAEIAWRDSTAEELMELVMSFERADIIKGTNGFNYWVASLNALYALKMSHRYLKNSPYFVKTRNDILTLRRNFAHINPYYQEWYDRREKETYSYGHPNLNVDKNDFFKVDDGVKYTYDHDSIHEAVKLGNVPAYTLFLEGHVKVSKEKWDNLIPLYQLFAVLEESYVLALERCLIPFPDVLPKVAFMRALEKVCTSITSGWFREFAWDNYDEVLSMYNDSYVDKFKNALAAGRIKNFNDGRNV